MARAMRLGVEEAACVLAGRITERRDANAAARSGKAVGR